MRTREEIREIQEMSTEELQKKVTDLRSDLFFMKVNAKTGQMEKTADIQKTKKSIARVLTELNSRKIAEANQGA